MISYTNIIGKFVKLYLPHSSKFIYGDKLKVKGVDIESQKLKVTGTDEIDYLIHVSYFRFLNNRKILLLK